MWKSGCVWLERGVECDLLVNLVLYDGVCGLCDRTVQRLLAADRRGVLRFAPLQGPTAKAVIARHPELDEALRSLVFVRSHGTTDEKVYLRSEGALRIARELGGVWTVVAWLRIVPRAWRDAVYDWVARNRYRWFGQFSECRVPSPGVKDRFLP